MDNYDAFTVSLSKYGQIVGELPRIKTLNISDFEFLSNKQIVFITTKNVEYIRNVQEKNLLKKYAGSLKVISSANKNYVMRIMSIYFQILLTSFKKYDYVFIGFAPQLICPIWGWKIRNRKIIDFFISVYDTLVNDRAVFSEKNVFAFFVRWLDRKTLKTADYIIADTKEHAKYFVTEFGADPERLGALYLQANKEIYYPREIPKQGKLKNKYVVLYFGSILPLQGVDVVLDCVRLLKEEQSIFFQIIGPVCEKDKLEQDNVEFISWLPESELAQHIAASDLCLAGHFNSGIDKAKRTIAGKTYIYEAMKKPIILGDNNANRELFTEDRLHYFVEMGNSAKLAELILILSQK